MSLPRSFASGLWLMATVASTAMVWTATSIVAAEVTDRPARVLAHQDVVSALESGPPVARSAPTSTTAKPTTTSSSTVPVRDRGAAPVSPGSPAPAAPLSQSLQPGVITPALPPPTTPTTAPGARPAPRPVSPPPTQAGPRATATYSTAGGVVGVACNGFFIDLISAIPSNGFAVEVVAGGPVNVDVHFRRAGQDLSVKVVCFGQPIRYFDDQIPQRPRSSATSPF